MNSIFYVINLALVLGTLTTITCQSLSKEVEEGNTPREVFNIGPFKLDISYNESNFKEKLRLNKSYLKFKISLSHSDRNFPDLAYGTMKMSLIQELRRCDNLTLEISEGNEILDCQPIEVFISNGEQSAAKSGTYVKRSSFRIKPKLPKYIPQSIQEYHLYPLSEKVVENTINDLVKSHNLGSLDFTDPVISHGYYFEHYIKLYRDEPHPLMCSGKLFLAVNNTESFSRFEDGTFPEFLDYLAYLTEQGWFNGYMLSFKDVSCSKQGYGGFFAVAGSFTIVQRLKFPYLSVHHTIKASPIEALLKYEAKVNQVLNPEAGPLAYNTSVSIESYSGLFELMNFKLEQVFANEDLEKGIEEMKFVHAKHGAAFVESVWNLKEFNKVLSLMTTNLIDDTSSSESDEKQANLKETLLLKYSNKKDDDFLSLVLRIKKDLIDPLLDNPFQQILNSVESELLEAIEKPSMKKEDKSRDEL